ncbi:MAG TPA: TonB-dependent receptor [Bacteroidales bacterium]|nr:TonB-dependent receptor [Bacteroidales bacterium]
MKRYFLAAMLLMAQCMAFAAFQETTADQDTLLSGSFPEVVVTANRYNSLAINTPEAIRVLNVKPVSDFQIRTAPEALTITPGVFVQKTNHGGGSPFIRGLTGNQTLLLIDGIRLSNSIMRYGPNQYFNTIDVFSLDRMEVLRGSGSVQYGSDALGGTINAFSHELSPAEDNEWGGGILGRIASGNMEKSLNSYVKYSGHNAALRSGITLRDFGDVTGGDTTGRQTPSGYGEFDYDIKGSLRLGPKSTLTALCQSVRQEDVPVYHKVILENYAVNLTDPQKRKLAYLRLNQEIDSRFIRSAVLTASLQKTEEGRESRKNGSDILRREKDQVRTLGFSAEAIFSGRKTWSGNAGIDIYNDYINSFRSDIDLLSDNVTVKRGLYPDGSTMTSIAFFTVHSIDLPRWNLTAGARYNFFKINVEDNELGKVKLTPSALVGNLAVMRKLNMKSNLFVSVNTGFRAPNIDDLGTLGIVDFRYETPNYDLKPENSVQYQAGYKYLGPKLRGDLFIYRNELYNLITRNRLGDQTIEGYPLYMKENTEHAFIQGIETAWDYKLVKALTFYGSLTYTYGQNITRNEPVRRIPPLFGRLAADYRKDKWFVCLEWLAAGKQSRLAQGDKEDNRIPEGGTPGWHIVNINSGITWNILTIDLSLQNLFNIDYRYHGSGINGYGRSVFLTLSVNS